MDISEYDPTTEAEATPAPTPCANCGEPVNSPDPDERYCTYYCADVHEGHGYA